MAEKDLQRKSSELEQQKIELKESTFQVVELENKMAGLLVGLRCRAGLSDKVNNSWKIIHVE